MGRRTGTASAASKPANMYTASAWRLSLFISNILYILLSILQMININPLKLALVPLIRRHHFNVPEPSIDSTPITNPPNRNTVVQGRDLTPAVQAEFQNDNLAAPPAPIPPAMITRRNPRPALIGSLTGIIAE